MKISFCKGLRKPLDWPSTLFKNATDIPQALGCKWGPLTCHRQFEVPRSRQPFEGRERHRLLLLGLELHYRCMEIVAFSRQGRLVQGWFFRSWKEAPFARWKPDRRTLSSTCSCDGIWREFCWLHSSSPFAVSTTRPAPWCPRRRPITKNSPVLLPGWTSRILWPFKVSCTSSSSRESRPDSDVVLLRHSGPFAVWVGSLSRLTPYYFWLLENSDQFLFARQLALNALLIPWAHHLPWS